ncbi:phage tail assembly chaperone [Sphingobium aquiterrae]|uniref:phage tail assembly chaperone n=1 Tax=Sphingobium aquiterrae TaxID=2038656 RepID=UPI003AFB6AFE
MLAGGFAQAAGRLSGMAAWLLGWRPGDFWAATPDELAAIWAVARGGDGAGVPPDSGQIARLKEMFPDG